MELTSRLGRVVRLDGVLMTILLGSLAINVYLGTRAQSLSAVREKPELIAAGAKAPLFEGTSPTGTKIALDFRDKRPTLLYVFSPTCHWCDKNLANIKTIIKTRQDLRIIGVNIGPKLDVETAKKQPFVEIIQPAGSTIQAYHFTGTPSTVLIAEGVVAHAWSGAYVGPIAAEVTQALGVPLPGLLDE